MKLVTLGQMLLQIETFIPHSDWEYFSIQVQKKKTHYDYTLILHGSRSQEDFVDIEALCGRFHTKISIESNEGVCLR